MGIFPTTLFRLPDGQEDNGKIRPKFSKWENPPQSPEWRSLHISDWCLKKLSKKTITTSSTISSTISSLASLSIFASVPFHPKSTLVLPCLASLFTGMCCMVIKNFFYAILLYSCGHLCWRRDDSWMEGYKSYLKSKKVEEKDKPIQNSLEVQAVSRVWGWIILASFWSIYEHYFHFYLFDLYSG